MAVELRQVRRDDFVLLMQCQVADGQSDFVVHNAITLAQAAYEPNAHVRGIWVGETLVGLTALIDLRGYPFLGEGDDPDACYIWRLMIDAAHQRRGYGRSALAQIEAWALERNLSQLRIAVVQTNVSAIRLYHSVGYRPTGRMVAGKMELSKTVSPRFSRRLRA